MFKVKSMKRLIASHFEAVFEGAVIGHLLAIILRELSIGTKSGFHTLFFELKSPPVKYYLDANTVFFVFL